MIFACLMEGEKLSHYVHRASALSGRLGTTSTWREILGTSGKLSASNPSGVDRLSEILGLEDKTYLIREHTAVPALKPFVMEHTYEEIVSGLRANGSRAMRVVSADKNRQAVRYCTQCARSDLNNFGFPYIRRQHCLQGVYVCHEHQCLLTCGCMKCAWSSGQSLRVVMASQACMCGEAAIPCMSVLNSRDLEFVGKVASIEAGFLSELSVSDAARESIGFAYHTRCLELGISNSPQFIDYFYTNVSDQIAQIYHFPLSSPSWLRKVVTRGGVPPTSVALNGVLVTLLFDSVTDLITAAQGAPRLVLADEETILDCREALLLKIERNYECRFFELKTEFREEFEYLNEYDSSWLRALRNSLSARSNNYLDVKAAWRFCPSKRFDQSLAEHMESRLKVLLDENCRPTKVTFSKLKSGFKCLCIPLAALRNMSISREIVEREVETSERFICRLIRYIIRYREKYPPGCAEYQLVHSISRELRDRLMQGMPEKGMEPEEVVSYVSNRRAQRCCS